MHRFALFVGLLAVAGYPEGVRAALAGFDLWKLLELVLVIVQLIMDKYRPKTN